jgi:hypothetical protein
LLDHEIHFFGGLGMAEVISKKGTTVEGVLHLMSADQIEKQEQLEGSKYQNC